MPKEKAIVNSKYTTIGIGNSFVDGNLHKQSAYGDGRTQSDQNTDHP